MNKIVTILTAGLLLLATSVFSQLTFTISPQPISGTVGDMVTLDVAVTNFDNIVSTQFSLSYDPSILQFVSVNDPDMVPGFNPGGFNNDATNGTLGLTWLDPLVSGVTLDDGTRFFTITFELVGNVGTDTRLLFATSPVTLEVTDGSGNELTIASGAVMFDDGTVGGAIGDGGGGTTTGGDGGTTTGGDGGTTTGGDGGTTTGGDGGTTTGGDGGTTTGGGTTGGTSTCQPPATGFAIIGSAEVGNVGETVCVSISAQDFTGIVSMQYSMNWDPAVLQYVSVQNLNLAGLSSANFNLTSPGNLGFAWSDQNATGVSVNNGDILYEVCYQVLASGTQTVEFSSSPVPTEIADNSNNFLSTFENCPATVGPPSGGGTTGGGTTGGTTTTCEPPASGFAIIGSAETGNVGETICVSISAQEFTGIVSMQYSMNWDPAVLRYSTVQNLNLPGLASANFNLISAGNLGYAWSDQNATGVTLNDGEVMYDVCFEVLAAGTQTVSFSSSPVPTEIASNAGIFLSSFANCPATIGPDTGTDPDPDPMDTCVPPASGFAILGSTETGSVGEVVCVQIRGQEFDNILSMQYSMNWDPAVLQYNSVQNFGLTALGSSNFNLITAGNLGIAWSDQNAVGVSFPVTDVLYEVCFDVLSEGTQELTFSGSPVPIEVVNSSGSELNFQSCPAVIMPGGVSSDFAIIASDQMASPSSTVCIPVTANGFTDIVSMQYSMNWDPNILTFSGVNIPNPANLAGLTNANFSSPSAGNLGLAWADPDATGKTVADGTLLYEVCFQVANNATIGSTTTISFSDSPVVSEIFTASGQNITFNNSSSTLTIDNVVDPSAVGVTGGNINGNAGSTVCMPIQVSNFSDIIGFQFSMAWDPAVLQFNRTQNYGLPGLTDAQFGAMQTGSGVLTFAWIDNTTQGVTLADGTIAFEVCFDVIGQGGSSSTINFVNDPTQIEVIRAGSGTVPLDPTGGSIIVGAGCAAISVQPETIGSSCAGFNNGEIRLNLSGGDGTFIYSWSGPSSGTQNTSNGVANITGLAPGNYTVTVSSCGGTSTVDNLPSFTITEPSAIMVSVQTQDASCNPDGRIVVSATGGSGNYTFRWNSNALLPSTGPMNVAAGTYALTVTDNTGCSTEVNNVTVNRVCNAQLAVTQNVIPATCDGQANGQVELSVNGSVSGLVCDWGGNGIFGCSPTNVPAGTYTVRVSEVGSGRESTQTITVGNSKVVTATASVTQDICASNDGEIIIIPNGGSEPYFYQWVGTAAIPNTPNPMGLPKGSYNVTVNDADGCRFSIPDIQVGGPDAPLSITPTGQQNTECASEATGAIAISVTGATEPYNYNWTNALGEPIPGDRTTTNLPAGVYSVRVSDINGCSGQQSYTIAANSSLQIDTVMVTGLAPTAAATVVVSGERGDLDIIWCNGDSTLTTDNLNAGICNVMVMDANCVDVASFEVGAPSIEVESITSTGISCTGENDAILTANAGGGNPPYNYSWSNGATSQVIVNAAPGEYTVTITDASGASAESTFLQTEPGEININMVDIELPCQDNGRISIGISGGASPYQVAWSNGVMNETEQNNLAVGDYGIIVTDANDCTASMTIPLPPNSDGTCKECYTSNDIITPNDDGRNDAFRLSCADITKGNVLRIFNRWGQTVYEAEGYSCVIGSEGDCWRGTDLNNQALPKGGYFWVLEFDEEGQRTRERGHVTILRE